MTRNIVDKKPIRIAVGATARGLSMQLVGPDGQTPISLTGNTVTFSLVAHDSPATLILDHVSATVVTPSAGLMSYEFATFPAAGLYRGWFERTITATSKKEPFPGNADYLLIEFYDPQETKQ